MIQKIKQKLKRYWRWFLITICGVGIVFAAPPTTIQEEFDKSELKDKYELKADKLVQKIKHIDDAKVEINTLEPQATLSRWDNEVDIKIKPKGAKKQKPDFEGEKIKFKEKEKEHHFYEVENGYEIETILLEKPNSNIVEYEIETKGLDFFYQPALTQEEIDDGAFRPENVIGSYAVYHSTKKNHVVGQKNYMTGKAFHIYRPLITDAEGAEVWGVMNIENGLLTVTVPQEFLDNAVYPVVVDPTFGKTDIGSSNSAHSYDRVFACKASLTQTGTPNSLHFYGKKNTAGTGKCAMAIYDDDGAGADPSTLKCNTAEFDYTTTVGWFSANVTTSPSLSIADWYIAFWSYNSAVLYYDSGAGYTPYDNATYSLGSPSFPNPFVKTSSYNDLYSFYATYEVAGATAALSGTAEPSATETEIVTGGETIILTLTGDTWIAGIGDDNATTTALINGIDSAQSEGTGWDAVVKANMTHAEVVRTSDTVVTITLAAEATYDITATETITATIPASALTLAEEIIATPTFTVTAVGAGTNMQINISDAWKDVELMKINIGDVWKDVEGVQINIGDSWETVY